MAISLNDYSQLKLTNPRYWYTNSLQGLAHKKRGLQTS